MNSTLLPDLPALPSDEIMTNAYRSLKRRAQTLMMEYWRSLPLPDYYLYPLRLSRHPFMGLGKFMAGRIHQMRSQKCYLAAHPSRFNAHGTQLCPLCGDKPERFSHAVLRCPVKASAPPRRLLSRPRRYPLVLILPPPLTGGFYKSHWYPLPTGHGFLSSFLSPFDSSSVLPL